MTFIEYATPVFRSTYIRFYIRMHVIYRWYDIACLMLSDPVNNITLHTFSQATPVNIEYVQQAQSETPADYGLSWSGLSVTVGDVMFRRNTSVDPTNWHSYYGGVSRFETLLLAAKQLAFMYKQRLSRS